MMENVLVLVGGLAQVEQGVVYHGRFAFSTGKALYLCAVPTPEYV